MSTMWADVFVLLLFVCNSCHTYMYSLPHAAHRSRRALLGELDGHHPHRHAQDHSQNPSQPTGLSQRSDPSQSTADSKGSTSQSSSSSTNSPPNSWLYKFPPWFIPGNPAPDGFSSFVQGVTPQISSPGDEFSTVGDGDILIVDDKVDSVRVPGNSAFQNEVVQTVLGVKYGQTQPPVGSNIVPAGFLGEIVTPWLVPQSVPEPPHSFPSSTVPLMPQEHFGNDIHNDFTSDIRGQDYFTNNDRFVNSVGSNQPHNNKQNVVTFSPQLGNTTPVIYNNNADGIFLPKFVTESTVTDFPRRRFRPSPPDPSLTARPFHVAQKGHSSAANNDFRPSQLISVTRVSAESQQHISDNGLIDIPVSFQGQQFHNSNNVNNNNNDNYHNFLRDQQAAFLKASDRPQTFRQQSFGTDNSVKGNLQSSGGSRDSHRIPFIPGIPFPILLHQSLQTTQKKKRAPPQQHQSPPQGHIRGGWRDLRQQHQQGSDGGRGQAGYNRPGPTHTSASSLPTSIQDIINSDTAPSLEIYLRTRDNDISIATTDDRTTSMTGTDGSNKWLWSTS